MKWVTRFFGLLFMSVSATGLYFHLDPLMGGVIMVGGIMLFTLDYGGDIK